MGIEKLKNSLLSEASEEANKIVQSAEAHVQAMLREERTKRKTLEEEAEKNIERMLVEQSNERIAWARLDAKRIKADAREDAIATVLEGIFEKLATVRNTPEYKKFLKNAVPNAVSELGKGTIIHILKGDKKLLPKISNTKIKEDLKGLGGALVENADGKIRIDLTLETLFETKRDEIRKQISDKLFGGKG